MKNFIFVEWSHGSMEGTPYNNVILNDGLLPLKVVNGVDNEVFASLGLKEGDSVTCSFNIRGSKTLQPKLHLTKIEKASNSK
jgi:hypothetical protein